jgi:peptidoglycan/xylan/chitin deacetylase (PgdA/CDA1 family)
MLIRQHNIQGLKGKRHLPQFFVFLLLLALPLLFSACGTGALSYPHQRSQWLFQSDDYFICKLQQQETAAALAQKFLGDRSKAWLIEEANDKTGFYKGDFIVIPRKARYRSGLEPNGVQMVPILTYHRFAKRCKSPLCTPEHIFEEQMRVLIENGYRVVSLSDLLDFISYRRSLPKKSVVITIDDGYRSAYSIAFPILKRYEFTATLFIYTDFVGVSKTAITWEQLRHMKNEGFEIGSHTVSHSDLTRILNGESGPKYLDRIEKELSTSKKILDRELDQNTIFLAFPYGRYNRSVLRICERVGYKIATTVDRGSNSLFANPLTLRRNQILKSDLRTFESRLQTLETLSLK